MPFLAAGVFGYHYHHHHHHHSAGFIIGTSAGKPVRY
jgi:hypothetical protein